MPIGIHTLITSATSLSWNINSRHVNMAVLPSKSDLYLHSTMEFIVQIDAFFQLFVLILYSVILLTTKWSFLVDSLGFFTQTIMSSINRDSLLSSCIIFMSFIPIYYPFVASWNSHNSLNNRGVFFPISGRKNNPVFHLYTQNELDVFCTYSLSC